MHSLSNAELSTFALFEMTPDLVCLVDKEGYFRKVNPAVKKILEYSEVELIGTLVKQFIHPEDRELTASKREALLNGKALVNFENRYLTKSNQIIWLHWTAIYIQDKEMVFAIAKDVTDKKLAEVTVEEQYLKFKNLAAHFKDKIEKDRKYFAVELHEDLAQLASAIKLEIESLEMHTPDISALAKEKIKNISDISHLMIDTIKRVAFTVSPYMLDDLGLQETMAWCCKEFSRLSNIHCNFESNFDEQDLSQEIKMDFFRICQESLSNVMQHAEADSVSVCLKKNAHTVFLYITDDGKGFKPDEKINTIGLTSMRELIISIDGELFIQSEPGKGTTICASVAKQIPAEYIM